MSSSKVIKPAQLRDQTICSFDYGPLSDDGMAVAAADTDDFIPLQIRECHRGTPQEIPATPLLPEPPQEPAPAGIPPEELQRQMDESYQRGVEEGRRQAERGLGNVFKALRDGVVGITDLREKILHESESDLLQLSIMVARRVIQQELKQDRQIIANIINAALSSLAELDRVTIRLNPSDYGEVNANRHLYLTGVGDEARLTLSPDETIEPGGCMVDTATGTVDARIEVQLDEIYRQLLEQQSQAHEAPDAPSGEDDRDERQG